MNESLRIGVLMGGISSEREVSLRSGRAVIAALQKVGYNAVALDVTCPDDVPSLVRSSRAICFFNALHGVFGEDGGVQQILDELHVPYTGSGVESSRQAMDKIASRLLFEQADIPVPQYHICYRDQAPHLPVDLKFPLVVKPAREGSSFGLALVRQPQHLAAAMRNAFLYGEQILVESYIVGREITVGILDDQALPIVEVVPVNELYDFESKYTLGKTVYKVPAVFSPVVAKYIQRIAEQAHTLLQCRCFSRVDMIVDEQGHPVVLEVNTIPGLTQTSLLPKAAAAAGITFSRLCERMVLAALHSKRETIDMVSRKDRVIL